MLTNTGNEYDFNTWVYKRTKDRLTQIE